MSGGGSLDQADRPGARWDALCARDDSFRMLFDLMDEGYCVIEFFDGPHGPLSDYIHVAANPAYAANAGIENVVGQRLRAMVPDEADAWVERYGEVLRTGVPIHFDQELVATGRHLGVSAFRLGEYDDRLVAVLFKDITAQLHAEREASRASEALQIRFAEALRERAVLAEIVEGTDAFVQVTDMDGRWLAINKAAADEFEDIFGIRPQIGQRAADLLADQPESAADVEAVWARALGGESFVETREFGDPGRKRRHYEMRFDVLRNADGEQVGAYQFVYDVTDRLQTLDRLAEAENALLHSQKMEAVGQLTGGLAHDFNNMLGGISGALELVEQRLSQGRYADVARYVEAARATAERASALTHRLLAFARRQTLSPSTLDVGALVEGMIDLVRRSVGPAIDVRVEAAPDLWRVRADAGQLENALLNLTINSRDAMPEGGMLVFDIANRSYAIGETPRGDVPAGDYLEIAVCDSGTGIAPAMIERVFEPFFTTKPLGEGTGLGLSMVYGFVTQSNGHVVIASEQGEGTRVSLLLPRDLVHEDAPGPTAEPVAAKPGVGTILVVDDEVLIRMTVVDELTDIGFTCLEAGTGPAALALFEEHPEIAMLVTDVGLPGGLNGRQIADAVRVSRPRLPVLFITGYADQAALSDDRDDAGMAVLTKPFRMADLVAQVERLLGTE